MKRIRTEPHDHGPEGDERIRTAEQAPGADPAYEVLRSVAEVLLDECARLRGDRDGWRTFGLREQSRKERLRDGVRNLYCEVDCRIEHGAESGGHLDFVRRELGALLNGRIASKEAS